MRNWWRRRRSSEDFREEIEAHLALEAERQTSLHGLAPDDARDAARRAFGNVTHARERFYESQRWAWVERLAQHLRYAVRALRRRPVFSVAAILTLAVGIGFNAAIFTTFYALGFRDLPARDADRLVNVYQQFSGRYSRGVDGTEAMVSYPEYLAYRSAIDAARGAGGALESAAVYADVELAFAAARSEGGALHGEYVSCNYFAVTKTRFARGRGFVADECARPGAPAVVVLAHSTWQAELGADTAIVGRIVRINSIPFTVVGVAEAGFRGLTIQSAGAWLPVTMQPAVDHGGGRDSILARDWSWLVMAARLAPGARLAAARAQLAISAARRDALYPGRRTEVVVVDGALLNFPEARQRGRFAVVLLSVLGTLVMAMVCANLMNLLLARGIARRREIGIRLAIGASRARLVEQLLTESALLALLGGLAGLALAYLLPSLMPRIIPVPGLQVDVSADSRVLAFTLATSLVTALIFGLVPALQATNVDLVSASKGGLRATGRQLRPSRLRAFVVGAQIAGSTVLLIVAALFVRAARHGATVDPGYATDGVVAFSLNLSHLGYDPDRSRQAYETLRDRIATVPGVQGVAFASPLPLLGRRSDSVEPAESGTGAGRIDDVAMVVASGTYLATMQIPLVAGRGFTDAEIGAGVAGRRQVVVSASLARALWGEREQAAIGRAIRMGGSRFTVVGVARDTRAVSLGATTPFVYLPGQAGRDEELRIVVRAAGALASLERAVPQWTREIDPAIVVRAQRMSERLALALRPARLASATAGAMGALTMFLALIGIYGVVSFAVSQRTRDIAVRLALGASEGGVVRLMMRQGTRAVVAGLVVGAGVALGASQVIRGVLLGISPLDPVAYIVTALLLLTMSIVATYAPARRAARVDPAIALREE